EVTVARPGPDGNVAWDVRRQMISSSWMDASHVHWFQSMLRDFTSAIDRGEHVGRPAVDSLRCIELIARAYESARAGSRELPLGEEAVDLETSSVRETPALTMGGAA